VKVEALRIADVKLLTPPRFNDPRGFFSETWNQGRLAETGIAKPGYCAACIARSARTPRASWCAA
jgi:dTDP-4-dehydrorhamnose 3,5-epimerase-like enzyme